MKRHTGPPVAIALAVFALACAMTVAVAEEEEPEFPHGDFDGDCETCHSDEGWSPAVLAPDFRKKTHPFPLRQAHDLPDCRACHRTLDFTKADPACIDCHTDPHRAEHGTDCGSCHVPRTFIDRRRMQRNHQQTRFPLRGTHRALDCEDCHRLGSTGNLQWVKTPTDCVDCHLPNYLATRNPNHAVVGFPTDCENCHRPTVWRGARFDHGAFFPIFSGEHRGRWSSCSTCHVNPNNFSEFSCFGCHPHSDRGRTDGDHSGEPGYQYNSVACYACHPRGEAP